MQEESRSDCLTQRLQPLTLRAHGWRLKSCLDHRSSCQQTWYIESFVTRVLVASLQLPSPPCPLSQLQEKGSKRFEVPLPSLGEGFRVRAKSGQIDAERSWRVYIAVARLLRILGLRVGASPPARGSTPAPVLNLVTMAVPNVPVIRLV